jgi:hypothetical protein
LFEGDNPVDYDRDGNKINAALLKRVTCNGLPAGLASFKEASSEKLPVVILNAI